MKLKNIKALRGTVVIVFSAFALLLTCIVLSVNFMVFAEDNVSGSDIVSGSNAKPPANNINFIKSPMKPKASGILTHVTSGGSSITVGQLFAELNLSAEDAAKVTDIECNAKLFDVSEGTGSSRVIKTKYSFDTIETLTFKFEDDTTLPIIFKDSRYFTNLNDLCTDIGININGKTYSANSAESYDDPIPVSGRKPYDLIVSFAELPDKQFSNYEKLEFTLPDGFVLPDDFNDLNHNININLSLGGMLRNNKVTYDKSSNKIFIEWNKDDQEAFDDFRGSSTAKFTLVLSGYLNPNGGNLLFSTGKQLHFVQENLHNAIVEKSCTYLSYKINYEIRVTSDGSNENLTLTDEMGSALLNPSEITFHFEDDKHADDPEFKPSIISNENGRFVMTIPKMQDEDVLIINYISNIDLDKIARSANATFEETGNTAKIVGDNDPSDNEASAWTSNVEFSDIEKISLGTKYYTKGGMPYCDVTWQVITNRNAQVNLADSDLTDVMDETAMQYSHYSGEGITVNCYNKEGELEAVRNIPWEDMGVDLASATTFTYHIPETDPPYKYVVEYKTSVNIMTITNQTFVANTVTGKCGIAEAGELINPPGPGNIAVSKKATNIGSDHVTWEIKAEIKNDAL